MPPIIAASGLVKTFPGVLAVGGVDLEISAGRFHALVGENGSGKSTLAKLISGQLRADAGTIEIDGEPVDDLHGPGRALALGIAAVSQELTLAPTLSIAENVMMGRLPSASALRTVSWSRTRALAQAALHKLGVDVDERRRVGDLSTELQQEIEIARAIATDPRVLILDEATSSLSEPAAQRLFETVEVLRAQGVAIVLISHRLPEVLAHAERATILRDGTLVDEVAVAAVDEEFLVRRMVGREISELFPDRVRPRPEPVLQVRDLSATAGAFSGVSFDVRAGEVVGVAGLMGSGKSELGLALAGDHPASGNVWVRGERVDLRSPQAALAAGIRFVPEDRKRAALFPTLSVRRNLAASWLSDLGPCGVVRPGVERALTDAAMRDYDVRAASAEVPIVHLSGGNQQKVIFARAAARGGSVFVLAEPTRGVDIGAKAQLYSIIRRLAEQGGAVLVVSSELSELLGLAERILVMHGGRVGGEFDRASSSKEAIARVALTGSNSEVAA